ncbi:hypothetical protein G6O69_10855 [Pseudenhygromyxa sp. WMMC2535]|uniref:hypothetical protein n=1 Tax=Pseudenhygromyxa sp. WMMC2535 TaxID=2712867 RepID=UPI0015572497|nr:hypothetical protein [Pseudenhygromyxa sp. WMMC2535]NVB38331.1 hypothetical protein [Pseudenhygromyxa sp. WMMC2535]
MDDEIEPKQLLTTRFTWGYFLAGQLVFAGLGWGAIHGPPRPDDNTTLAWILSGLGVVTALVAPFVVRHLVVPSGNDPVSRAFNPLLAIMSTALAASMFAFMTFFIASLPLAWALPALAGLGLSISMYPTPTRVSALARRP